MPREYLFANDKDGFIFEQWMRVVDRDFLPKLIEYEQLAGPQFEHHARCAMWFCLTKNALDAGWDVDFLTDAVMTVASQAHEEPVERELSNG